MSGKMRYRVARLPDAVGKLCELLAAIKGVDAVVIGGSRAAGVADIASDWDIGLYYRGDINLRPLLDYGEVHPPGSWGRIMNGGAWLSIHGMKVDVLLRDLDIVRYWAARGAGRSLRGFGWIRHAPAPGPNPHSPRGCNRFGRYLAILDCR